MVFLLEDLAFHVDRDLAREIAARDRRRHLRDVAHLRGQVARHRVDAVGQVFPRAGNAADYRLTSELALCADFARHARHFRGETVELVNHRVDGVFQLEDFPAHIDCDFF